MQNITQKFSTLPTFASTYGNCAYGTSGFNSSTGCTTASQAAPAQPSGSLVTTGSLLIIIVTAACLLAFTALVVRFWKKPKTNE